MTREERLKYCSICKNREMNIQRGMLCGLSHEYASFESACSDFNADDAAIKKQLEREEMEKQSHDEPLIVDSEKMRGASWFAWIGGLSLINSFGILIGFRLIFGLGITTLFDLGAMEGNVQWLGIIVSAIYSGFFIWTYFLAVKKELEISYIMGYFIYLLDAILLIVLSVKIGNASFVIDILFHIGLLASLYARHPFFSDSIFSRIRGMKFSIGYLTYMVLGGLLGLVILGMMF